MGMTIKNAAMTQSYAAWFSFTGAGPLHGICAIDA